MSAVIIWPFDLPSDPLLRDYWVYEGSLTTPPCSEKVTWILFRYPLTISQVQVRAHSEPLTLTLPSITSDTHHSSVLQVSWAQAANHTQWLPLINAFMCFSAPNTTLSL